MILRTVGCAAALLVGAIGPSQSQAVAALAPQVEHYQHLLSPTLAVLLAGVPAAIELPAELHGRFQKGMPRFDDAAGLAELYTDDAVLIFSFAPQGPRAGNLGARPATHRRVPGRGIS